MVSEIMVIFGRDFIWIFHTVVQTFENAHKF